MNSLDNSGKVGGKVGSYRWGVVTVLFVLYTINLIDRFAVLTLLPVIRTDLNLNHQQIAMAASVFFFVYAFAQAWSGWLADRIGAKKVIYIGLSVFTFVSFITGSVKNFTHLMLVRAGLALGEGHHWSPSLGLIANWMPAREKARATSLLATSAAVAPAFVPILVTTLAVAMGSWRSVFYLLIIPGLIGLLALWYFIANHPEEMVKKGRMSQAECDYIKEGVNVSPRAMGVKESLKFLLGDRYFWVFSLVMFFGTAVGWGNNTWLSIFLMEQHGLNLKAMGLVATVPFVIAIFAVNISGYLADKWFKGRLKPLVTLGFIPCALFFYLITTVTRGDVPVLISYLFLIGFFGSLWIAAYAYPAMRYPQEVVGTAVGFSQLFAQFGGFFAVTVCGSLVKKTATGFDHTNVMLFFAGLALLTAFFGLFLEDKKKYMFKEDKPNITA